MADTTHRRECSADAALYIGVELSARKWLLVMGPSLAVDTLHREVAAGDGKALRAAIAEATRRFGFAKDVRVRSCYEAGRDGFWPHRLLTALGIDNRVVDSSSIEVSRRKRPKTDRIDGRALRRMLWRYWQGERGLWQVVQVPPVAREDARQASRALTSLQEDRTRYRNRIHSLLALHGVRLPLTAQFPARLALAVDWAGQVLPPGVRARVLQAWRLLQHVETERRQLQREEQRRVQAADTPARAMAARLVALRAIGSRTATVLSEELFSRGLRNRREVGGLLGFGALPHDSGDRHVDQGIAAGGVRAVRRIAVEVAWSWLRYQPRSSLSRWYEGRWARGGPVARRIGIVALARRLMIALWRYVTLGTRPEGADLKVA